VEQRLVKLLGTSAKHILVALERTFRAVALTGLITFIVILVGVEAVAYLLTHEFPPTGSTHLAAAALAVAFAYAAAITVALVEILRGIIRAIELIVEESEKLAGAALREGETLIREGGEEVGRVARGAISEAESIGRGVGGAVTGVVGGVGSAVGREARAVESHLPGHHSGSGGSGSESSGSR
jgi:phage-related protein